jgi:ankyrin repeat protein
MRKGWRKRPGTALPAVVLMFGVTGWNSSLRSNGSDEWALHTAVEACDVRRAEKLLAAGAGVNARDEAGRTPLHRAAAAGSLNCVGLLLDRGADVNVQDRRRQTPLHKASVGAHDEVVKVLISRGATVNALDDRGHTALDAMSDIAVRRMKAADCIRDYGATARLLEESGAGYGKEVGHEAPQHVGPASGRFAGQDPLRRPPLHKAAIYGGVEEAERALGKGADADVRDAGGRTALHVSAFRGMRDRVEFFLRYGADVNAQDEAGNTPLHYTAGEGYTEVVRILIAHGADVHAVNMYRETPLSKLALGASRWAQESAYEEYGVGKLGSFAETAELLIASGSSLEAVELRGGRGTPLHHAAYSRYDDVAKALVAHGADISAPNDHGRTACAIAREEMRQELSKARMLARCRELGHEPRSPDTDVNVKGDKSRTRPPDVQLTSRRKELVRLLCEDK